MDKFPIVTLCGSTRFKQEYLGAMKKLTLEGKIVISVGLWEHSGDAITEEQKRMLDEMHFRKIDLADSIFVINPEGYIGDSARRGRQYAFYTWKKVEYLTGRKNKNPEIYWFLAN